MAIEDFSGIMSLSARACALAHTMCRRPSTMDILCAPLGDGPKAAIASAIVSAEQRLRKIDDLDVSWIKLMSAFVVKRQQDEILAHIAWAGSGCLHRRRGPGDHQDHAR